MNKKVHVIDFHWENFIPKMYCYSDKIEEFSLCNLDLKISREMRCVGKFKNGNYIPCPNKEKVSEYIQCSNCAELFIGELSCIFEPKCNGERCIPKFCQNPHAVYLAFFNELPKVGMTYAKRIRERVIEQGADAFSIIKIVGNRKEARDLEKKISKVLRIPQSQNNENILRRLCFNVNKKGIEYKFKILKKGLTKKFEIEKMNLIFLEDYPISQPLRSKPRLRKTEGLHKGKVIGIKGKFLIYDANGLNALKLPEVPGRYIHFL